MEEQAGLCPGCQKPRDECMKQENQHRYQAAPLRCFACEARDLEVKRWNEAGGSTAGMYFPVVEDDD